jgi:hypothetical protein
VRGTTEAIRKADAMLKELAVVYPDAGKQLQAGIPKPPPIEEVFRGTKFGVPDWDAGARHFQATSIDIQRVVKALPEPPAPAVTTAAPATGGAAPKTDGPAENPVAQAIFHVEIQSNSSSRDLVIRKVGGTMSSSGAQVASGVPVKVITDPPGAELRVEGDAEQHCKSPCILSVAAQRQVIKAQIPGYRAESRTVTPDANGASLEIVMQPQLGYVQFDGLQSGTPVMLDGKAVTYQGPARLSLVAGTYEVRFVRDGQVLSRQNVEVKDQGTVAVAVKQ